MSGPADDAASAPPAPTATPMVRRLTLYLRELERLRGSGAATVSSRQLGDALSLTDAQVRKDLAAFGQFGQPGVGYRVAPLIERLRNILGTDRTWNVLLAGAGNIGRALLTYKPFEPKGFRVVAVVDSDPRKIGRNIGGLDIHDLSAIPELVRRHQIVLAILAVPAPAAQPLAEQLAQVGVRGLLNFAPVTLQLPEGVFCNSVDLVGQMEQLAFRVKGSTDS